MAYWHIRAVVINAAPEAAAAAAPPAVGAAAGAAAAIPPLTEILNSFSIFRHLNFPFSHDDIIIENGKFCKSVVFSHSESEY